MNSEIKNGNLLRKSMSRYLVVGVDDVIVATDSNFVALPKNR